MFRIEKAAPQDAPRIREIMELAVLNLQSRDWFVDDDIPFITDHMEKEGYILKYTLCDSSLIAGYIMVRKPGNAEDNLGKHIDLPQDQYSSVTHIESTGVDPAYRGRGIFRTLLEAAIESERMDEATRYLMATVHPDNVYSKNILIRAGFEPLMTIAKYGDWVRTILCLDLRAGA